jgi:glycosyltransferase involved in cell wall biosynthesis
MKIVAILETTLKAGGAYHQSLSALLQMKRICKGRFNLVVIAFDKGSITILQKMGLDSVLVSLSIIEKIKSKLLLSAFWSQLFLNRDKILFPLEKKLLRIDTDLVYFLGPSLISLDLKKLNYIFTLFDLAHRDSPEFPEVREFNEFRKREKFYSRVISQSIFTLTDSKKLSENVSKYYGVDLNHLIDMPYSASPALNFNSISITEVRGKYKLPEFYFYYPAQFWPHKNHFRILEALKLLSKSGNKYHLVFSGGDKGNLDYIKKTVKKMSLTDQVHILGLVPTDHMKALFQGSIALIMPTYFGPTNIPPLEAWDLGTPVIYSSHLSSQTGDAALLIDPDSSESLAKAMIEVAKPEIRGKLISKGYLKIEKISKERVLAEQKILDKLTVFEKRLQCWPK